MPTIRTNFIISNKIQQIARKLLIKIVTASLERYLNKDLEKLFVVDQT